MGEGGLRIKRHLLILRAKACFQRIIQRIIQFSQFIYESFHILHVIAQLVEHRTGIAEATVSNPVEALIFFFQASSFQLL